MLKKALLLLATAAAGTFTASSASAQAQDQFLGQMILVPYTFCPKGWIEANGQLVSIAQNSALFALLGTTYGGNGQTNFALPNMQGRAAIHLGTENGNTFDLGQAAGADTVTQLTSQMPTHTHMLMATNSAGTSDNPSGNLLADFPAGSLIYAPPPANAMMAPQAITPAGNGQPMSIRDPYLTMRYCIAMSGVFPSRN